MDKDQQKMDADYEETDSETDSAGNSTDEDKLQTAQADSTVPMHYGR